MREEDNEILRQHGDMIRRDKIMREYENQRIR